MDDSILKSGKDTLLAAIPFVMCLVGIVTCLVFSIFRLDVLLFKSGKSKSKSSKNSVGLPPRGVSATGAPIFTDPDGRLVEWPDRRSKSKTETSGQPVAVD